MRRCFRRLLVRILTWKKLFYWALLAAIVCLSSFLPGVGGFPALLSCPFLNGGLEYVATPLKESALIEASTDGTWCVIIRIAERSHLNEWFGSNWHIYWVEEPLTCEKLQLIEFDFLIRGALVELLIPVEFLHRMSEQQILWYGERLFHGWHFLRDMAYPDVVSDIQQNYLEATEAAGLYFGGSIPPTTATMIYRGLSEVGVGGSRGFGYHSNDSRKLICQATMGLLELLEDQGIAPY